MAGSRRTASAPCASRDSRRSCTMAPLVSAVTQFLVIDERFWWISEVEFSALVDCR